MHKRGIAVLLLFMAAAILHAGKHTDLRAKISFDFGGRTLEEVSALYDKRLDILGGSYKLEERYKPRRDSYFHWIERWTYLDRSNRLDGQDFAILMNFHAGQKSPFLYMRKSSVQGSLCFEEFFLFYSCLVQSHKESAAEIMAAYRDFQKGMLLAIKSFTEERNVKVTGYQHYDAYNVARSQSLNCW